MELTLEADTLHDALRELAIHVPSGEFVITKRVENTGQNGARVIRGTTIIRACVKAQWLVPPGVKIIECRLVHGPQARVLEIQASSEDDACRTALQQTDADAHIRSTERSPAGRRGILDVFRRASTWHVTVDEPAVIEVHYRARVRVTATTAPQPRFWHELATAMETLNPADAAPANRLKELWPFQTAFLLMNSARDECQFGIVVRITPVVSATVQKASDYVNRQRIPGALAPGIAAERSLQPHRFRLLADGRIAKVAHAVTDAAILRTAHCLPRSSATVTDPQRMASLACKAIQHYAALPIVHFCFSLPYLDRADRPGGLDAAAALIDVYKGTEALLLEIWEELDDGETITEERVTHRSCPDRC